ncbi:MAG TPA: 16S rRNA (guanine(966)-N(2))-methyltransferase RsmD [Rhodopila sp.]|jgi:16S rRNA (guanine966-N2)-methyltransferase
MRIVAGAWRGRSLVAPLGQATRPTADRVRQALFDTLMHAEWAGRTAIEGAAVLDVFAGTGALGLEALSRGAATATFIESDPTALRALRTNIAACKAESRTKILVTDALLAVPVARAGADIVARAGVDIVARTGADIVFLDPPYGRNLVPRALTHLHRTGHLRPGAFIIAETGRDETWLPEQPLLAERQYAAARILVFRAGDSARDCY